MPVIVVANPKGGIGKSTLSTQVAGYWANQGREVLLGDVDAQGSARTWLDLRPPTASPITLWEVAHDDIHRPPKRATHVVLDTPAGLEGQRLHKVLKFATRVLVPVQASVFDIHATHAFLQTLLAHPNITPESVALVGVRVKDGTFAAEQLRRFTDALPLKLLTELRETHHYLHLAAQGLSLWDVTPSKIERDLEQWRPITRWLDRA